MARPPRFKSFTFENFPEAPEWFRRFLQPLNETLGDVTGGLSGRLSTENLVRQVKKLSIRTKDPVANTWPVYFKNELPVKPFEVRIAQIRPDSSSVTISEAPAVVWDVTQDNQIKIINVFGLSTADTLYHVTFVCEG